MAVTSVYNMPLYGIMVEKIIFFPVASLVQLVERRSPKPDVEGSSPSGRVLDLALVKKHGSIRVMLFYWGLCWPVCDRWLTNGRGGVIIVKLESQNDLGL
jgi:hypothetical protein